MRLEIVDTEPEPDETAEGYYEHKYLTLAQDTKGNALGTYWRSKYLALQDESTPATIRSLRSQLQSIRQVLQEETDPAETKRRILVHVELGLQVSRKQ